MNSITQLTKAPTGATLHIPCRDAKHMQSVKMRMWRELKKFKATALIDPEILITVNTENEEFFVVLMKMATLPGTFMLLPNGEKIFLRDIAVSPQKERAMRQMKEDSLSREEAFKVLKPFTKAEAKLFKELFPTEALEEKE